MIDRIHQTATLPSLLSIDNCQSLSLLLDCQNKKHKVRTVISDLSDYNQQTLLIGLNGCEQLFLYVRQAVLSRRRHRHIAIAFVCLNVPRRFRIADDLHIIHATWLCVSVSRQRNKHTIKQQQQQQKAHAINLGTVTASENKLSPNLSTCFSTCKFFVYFPFVSPDFFSWSSCFVSLLFFLVRLRFDSKNVCAIPYEHAYQNSVCHHLRFELSCYCRRPLQVNQRITGK